MQATPLEESILEELYVENGRSGFPPPSEISILARTSTACGRYIDLRSSQLNIPDGHYDLGGKFIAMEGVQNGLMAVVLVKDGFITQLEITSYGGEAWNGAENKWSIQ